MVQNRQFHWIDWALFAVYTLWFLFGIATLLLEPETYGSPPVVSTIALMLLGYALPMIFWREGYIHPFLFGVVALLVWGGMQLFLTYYSQNSIMIIQIPAIIIGYLATRRVLQWIVPPLLTMTPISILILMEEPHILDVPGSFFNLVLTFGVGYSLNRILASHQKMKQLLEENQRQFQLIQEQNQILEQYSKEVEEITLLEERDRMAREMHDTVGHTFTSVIMGMDAVQYLIEASPEQAKTKLDVLRQLTRNGLDEVRRFIHSMAAENDNDPLSQMLSRVAGEFSLHTGTRINLQTRGKEPELSKQLKWTMLRCMQESLTNAKRHGSAANIDVLYIIEHDKISLIIEDDGVGMKSSDHGFGLNGMKERLSSLQGSLYIESAPGAGTTVTCQIPIAK